MIISEMCIVTYTWGGEGSDGCVHMMNMKRDIEKRPMHVGIQYVSYT